MKFSSVKKIPLWLSISIIIFGGTVIEAYLAGEITRKLDTQYLVSNVRVEMQRATSLLSHTIAEAVVTKDVKKAGIIIEQTVTAWPEISYLHIEDDYGVYVTKWEKDSFEFGDGIIKFEAPIIFGEQKFGILCVYADLRQFYADMRDHINEIRRRSALILMMVALFVIAFVDILVIQPEKGKR